MSRRSTRSTPARAAAGAASCAGSDGGEIATSGIYRIVKPPRRLAFTWAWEDQSGARGHETEVTVSSSRCPVARALC